MVPLSPFNDTLVMVAEWVGDTGLLAVSGDEILYMVGCELKVLPLSFKIENERQTKQYTFFCLLCYCYWYHVDPLFCSGLFTARSKSFDSTIYLIRTRLREWGNSRKFLVYTNFLIQIENHRILVVETSTIFYVWFYPNQADLEFAILSIKTPIIPIYLSKYLMKMHFILFVKPDIESRSIQRLTGRGQGSVTNRVYQGELKNWAL